MVRFPMLDHAITDRRAWTAATIDDRAGWSYALTGDCRAILGRLLATLANTQTPITDVELGEGERHVLAEGLATARGALEEGRGFAIVEGLPGEAVTPEQATLAYWIVGQALGRPFAQNVQGTLLYDVRDTGYSVGQGVRFSVTNAESTFHTDNSFGEEVLDYVGLLCLNTARDGGLSQVTSAYSVHNVLLKECRDLLQVLYQPFHVDRRGGVLPGEPPTAQRPIISWDGRELTVRYLRYWIEVGHEKAGVPLASDQLRALDALDAVLARPGLRVEFDLKPGQMFYINNRSIFHNRTAFEDHAEPERKRHYVRLWLQARDRGALVQGV